MGNPYQAASDSGNASIKARADKFANKILPVIKDQLGQGKTMKEVAAYLNQEGYQTARGGDWYASTVSNALRRAA